MKHDTTVVQTQRTQTEAAYTAAASTENTAVFQTLSDLKQSTFLQAGDVVETAGYYELGDGGGARYEIVSNTTADGYLTHSLSNGLTAQMIIQDNRVNVRQLGAKGDGVTDDTAAINAATKSGIRHVYVPAGTYLVTPTLTDYPYWVSNPKYKNRRACIYLDENLSSFCGDGISHTIIKVTPQTQRYFSVICPLGVMNGLEIGYLTIDQNVDNCPIAPEVLGGTQDEWDEGHYRDCYKLYCIHGTFYNSRIHDCKFLHMGSNAIYANGFNYRVDNNELIFDMNRSEDIDYSYSNVAYDNSALFLCGDFVYVRHNFIYTYLTPGEVYITGTQNHQVVTAMATARGAVETHASHA